jgi:hypothetical protein
MRIETTQSQTHEERAETQSRIQKSREQEVSAAVKDPRKIEFEIESPPSKFASRKYLQNGEIARLQKGQESSASVLKGELTARAAKEDRNDTEIPSPDNTKINDAKLQIDATVENVVV